MNLSKLHRYYLYLTVFLSGAAVLVLEILGTRILAPFYGSTIFVWASLITVTLGTLSLGYLFGGKIADRNPNIKNFFLLIFWAGVLFLIPLKISQWVLPFTDRFGIRFGPLVASIFLFFLPLLLLGMLTPFAIRLLAGRTKESGSVAGGVFAISTIGSVLGALLAGFFLLPHFSLTQVFLGVGVILVVVSFLGLWIFKKGSLKFLAFFMLVAFLVPKLTDESAEVFRLVEQRQSFFGDIKIIQIGDFKCLYVDGSSQTCVNGEGKTDGFYQRFLRDEIPALGLKKDDKVLLLGLGGGGVLEYLPEEVSVDIVELDQEVVEVAKKWFGFQPTEMRRVIVDDARHFLATSEKDQYDLVLENLSLGIKVPDYMMSVEVWRDLKKVVKPSGVVLTHMGTHEVDGDNKFNQAVWSSANELFSYTLALSSQPEYVANLIFYLSDQPFDYTFAGERYPANLEIDRSLIVTDDKNPLDYWYLSNAISYLKNTKKLGNNLYYVQ